MKQKQQKSTPQGFRERSMWKGWDFYINLRQLEFALAIVVLGVVGIIVVGLYNDPKTGSLSWLRWLSAALICIGFFAFQSVFGDIRREEVEE